MSHAINNHSIGSGLDPDTPAWLRPLAIALHRLNHLLVWSGMLALLVASIVLTYSVFARHVMQASTDWQDEAAVFCIVGATFLSCAYVQSLRGHVGIEALASWLSPTLNRLRLVLIDALSLAFCIFFSWKSWALFHEAWTEGQTTSSTWAPPLWIPYALMAVGMTLLSVQLAMQLCTRANSVRLAMGKESA